MTSARSPVDTVVRALAWCTSLALIYCLEILWLPISHTDGTSHLNSNGHPATSLFVAVPMVLVWLTAFWSYARLALYAKTIAKTPEGPHITKLASGLAILAWSLPINNIINRFLTHLAYRHNQYHAAPVILDNYLMIFLPLTALVVIGGAAHGLLGARQIDMTSLGARFTIAFFAVAGISYAFLVLHRLHPLTFTDSHNIYSLPLWLVVPTLILPYIYMWFIGILAAYEINLLARNSNGVIYRRALSWLAGGLGIVILSSVAIQYASGLLSPTVRLQINYHTFIILLTRTVSGLGFLMMAIGANRLKRIEEI